MDDKKFIKHIQDKLSQHRVAVSDDLWEKVSSALPSSPVWYKHPYLYASVAVVAALVIVCCCLYNDCVSSPCTRQDTHQQHLLCSCDTISDIDNRDFIIHLPADSVGIVDCEKKSCKQPSVVLPSMQTQQITDRGRELLAIVGEVDMLDTDTFTVAEVTTSHVIDIDTPLIAYCCNDESQYFDDKAIQSISNSVKNTREQSTFFSFEATTSPCRTVVSPLALRSSDAEVEFSHKMPLAVRALFEKRFGRWGVGLGLSYTYMTSDYKLSYNQSTGVQQLHYVGIPLYLSYEFARVGKFAFYTSLGGQMDINTAGLLHKSIDNQITSGEPITFRDKTLQFSVQLRIGAAYEIIEHLDVFVEPVLGYYFDNESTVHSIWQDTPWNTSLAFGVRTWF